MSYAAAQARYDAMEPDDTDDDIYESSIGALRDALRYIDCDEMGGSQHRECIRRTNLIRARIAELEKEVEG